MRALDGLGVAERPGQPHVVARDVERARSRSTAAGSPCRPRRGRPPSRRSRRTAGRGRRTRGGPAGGWAGPAPIPKSSRPPETTSTVVAILASIAGGRIPVAGDEQPEAQPSRLRGERREQRPALEDRAVGSPPIGMRWSNSHACSISGTASASCQTRRRSSYSTCIGAVRIPKLVGDISASRSRGSAWHDEQDGTLFRRRYGTLFRLSARRMTRWRPSRSPAGGPTPGATRRPCSTRPPRPSSPPASRRRCATSRPGPGSGWARSTATSRHGRTSSSPSTATRSRPCAEAGATALAGPSTAVRRPGPVDRPLRRLPRHQARPGRRAARRRRVRGPARLLPRPARARLRRAARRGRRRGRDPLRRRGPRAHARRREPLHRGGTTPATTRGGSSASSSRGCAGHRRRTSHRGARRGVPIVDRT